MALRVTISGVDDTLVVDMSFEVAVARLAVVGKVVEVGNGMVGNVPHPDTTNKRPRLMKSVDVRKEIIDRNILSKTAINFAL